jgi:RND family efflux transporter MFP subunit
VIYPRADGYVHEWHVDIGDHVEQGQLLAQIDTPEVDQQLAQARAELTQAIAAVAQASAHRDFANADLARYQQLTPAGFASRADLDQRQASASVGAANVSVAEAAVGAQRANIRRLTQLQSFGRVLAPFAGTITSRTIERGALVAAGNSTPLFRLVAMDPARVFAQVPQDVAPSLHAGVAARITVREYAGRVFEGTVARTAGALDAASRTMNTEIRVANADGALIAGMYAEVSLSLPIPHRVLELPATALINDAHGLRVAVVQPDHTLHLTPVVVERDTGSTVQISSGLTSTDQVVRVVHAGIIEGVRVETTH